ncbi:MAG: rhomboid family intramembrane serine protease [Pseudomonadales bacterium]
MIHQQSPCLTMQKSGDDTSGHPPLQPATASEQWVSLRHAHDRRLLAELGLVLDAVAIDNRLHRLDDIWHLLVRESAVASASDEIASWYQENPPVKRLASPPAPSGNGWWAIAAFLAAIWLPPFLEDQLAGLQLRESGVLDTALVRAGAWWLTVTAVTLHADLAHLAGNSLFGSVFGYLLGRYVGAGVGWLCALCCAALANGTNVLLQAEGFRSLGASTAVFAALGITGAYAWQRGFLVTTDWRRRFAPAFAAIALIAFTGASGERTDVFGHLFGFLYGFAAGWLLSRMPDVSARSGVQWSAAFAAVALLGFSWHRV